MEELLAQKLAKRTVMRIPDIADKERVIAYGYELLITSSVGVLLLIVCSFVSGIYLAWIPFLIGFAPLRTVAGGYHAPTHVMCYLVTISTFCICLAIAESGILSCYHLLLITVVAACLILLFAPVAATNKPLTKLRFDQNRKRSIICILFWVAFSVILCLIKFADVYTTISFLGVAAASGSLIVAKIINHFRKEEAL